MNKHTEAVLDFMHIKRELQEYTVTPMGNALAEQLQPVTDAAVLDSQLQETSQMVICLAAGEAPPLTSIVNLRPHLSATQIEGLYLEGWQLLEVADGLDVIQRLRRYAHGLTLPVPLLRRRITRLADFNILLQQIRHAIDDKGYVRDHASPTLQRIRQRLKRLRERVHTKLRELMTTHRSVVQDALITIRNNRFVVPLKTDFHQALRGIVHGESASGATVYVEPDSVVELNNQLQHVQAEEERAVRQVLQELTKRFAMQRVMFEQALQILGEIDLIRAKGQLSLRMQGIAPRFATQSRLELLAARHPLLSEPVPVDIHLGPESRTLVITGPNTGGKTAALKTVGLLVLMAQSGLHIPANADSTLPIFTDVFVDLGDEQSLQQNLSTFSAHLANICTIMQHVSARSLVLLDELGAGTDPMEGGPLGVAILERFHTSGAMTLVTTHHSTVKAFAVSTPDVACAAVDFDLETLQPRYQLVYGLPGRSKAFAIAKKLGVPAAVISRAEQEAGMTQMRSEQLLARLEVQRQELDEAHRHIQAEHAEVGRLREEARQAHERARAQEAHVRQGLYTEGTAWLKTARQELDVALAALRRQVRTGQQVAFPQESWQRMVDAVTALGPAISEAPPPPQSLKAGDQVRVRGLNITGRLLMQTEGNGPVQVAVGNKTLTVAAAELERAETISDDMPPARPALPRRHRKSPLLQETIPPELRLLGYTVAEALPMVEKYLDQAFMQGLSRVRIVHGVGSGRLREAIAEMLNGHPLVHRFQTGDASGGVTIVELER